MPTAAELTAGQTLEPLIVESVDPARMKTMAAILQDPNPIHFDAEVVKQLGYGDRPVNQGPLNMGYLLEMVSRFAGGPAAVRHFRVRFLGNVFAGDRVECTGTVTSVDADDASAELEVTASVAGEPVLSGTASVHLDG